MVLIVLVAAVLITGTIAFTGLFRPLALYRHWLRRYERHPSLAKIDPFYGFMKRWDPKWHVLMYRAIGIVALAMFVILLLALIGGLKS